MSNMRVVSLLPSATEIVAALGCADRLVGRSHECDFPVGVERLPALTAPRLKLEGLSGDIDKRVKEVLAKALSVYEVDADRLRVLAPDLIVTQSQCEVCAVSLPDVEAATCDWTGQAVEIVSLAAVDLAGVWTDVRRVAASLALPDAGDAVVRQAEARIATIAARAADLPQPSVACIEWLDPLMAAGNWMPELIALAGGRNLFGEAGKHSPWMTWDDLAAADPEVILVLPCGFDLARNRSESTLLARDPRWRRLSAVRSGRVYLTDGNQYFNRPGPRLVESLEIVAEILHPQAFDFGHRGAAWEPMA
jgi:iron complex transport system substrate-binding protein